MKPILFKTEMVRQILAGTKTQTRRLVKPQPDTSDGRPLEIWYGWPSLARSGTEYHNITPPYKVGDVLWVRETWFHGIPYENDRPQHDKLQYWYRADTGDARPGDSSDEWCINEFGLDKRDWPKWKPSLFMPREACRLFLEVTNIRVERLLDISEEDALAEGVERCMVEHDWGGTYPRYRDYTVGKPFTGITTPKALTAKYSYETLWEKINGKGSWDLNPYVFVYDFKRIDKP